MFFPTVGQGQPLDPNASFWQNNKVSLSFLGIGGVITALGVTLMCLSTGQAMMVMGSIATTLGVPLVSYGIIMMIFNGCTGKMLTCCDDKKKDNDREPIKVKDQKPETAEEKEKRETESKKRADAANKRIEDNKKAEEEKKKTEKKDA